MAPHSSSSFRPYHLSRAPSNAASALDLPPTKKTANDPSARIVNLPNELLGLIFRRLSVGDLKQVRRVCFPFNESVMEESKRLFPREEFNITVNQETHWFTYLAYLPHFPYRGHVHRQAIISTSDVIHGVFDGRHKTKLFNDTKVLTLNVASGQRAAVHKLCTPMPDGPFFKPPALKRLLDAASENVKKLELMIPGEDLDCSGILDYFRGNVYKWGFQQICVTVTAARAALETGCLTSLTHMNPAPHSVRLLITEGAGAGSMGNVGGFVAAAARLIRVFGKPALNHFILEWEGPYKLRDGTEKVTLDAILSHIPDSEAASITLRHLEMRKAPLNFNVANCEKLYLMKLAQLTASDGTDVTWHWRAPQGNIPLLKKMRVHHHMFQLLCSDAMRDGLEVLDIRFGRLMHDIRPDGTPGSRDMNLENWLKALWRFVLPHLTALWQLHVHSSDVEFISREDTRRAAGIQRWWYPGSPLPARLKRLSILLQYLPHPKFSEYPVERVIAGLGNCQTLRFLELLVYVDAGPEHIPADGVPWPALTERFEREPQLGHTPDYEPWPFHEMLRDDITARVWDALPIRGLQLEVSVYYDYTDRNGQWKRPQNFTASEKFGPG